MISIRPRTQLALGLLLVACTIAAAIGRLTWDGHAGLYALALLPLLWWLLPSRGLVAASVFAYYFASLLPVSTTILGYYPNWPAAAGWAMLAVVAGVNSLPWILGWAPYSASPVRRAAGLLLAVALGVLPPLGVIAWVHPLLSAGWIYPGGAWWSLLVVLLLWLLVAWRPRASALATSVLGGAAVAVATGLNYREPTAPPQILGINTQLMGASSFTAFSQKLTDISLLLNASGRQAGQVAVLPETTLDEFKASTATMIRFALGVQLRRGPILSGTTFHTEDGRKWSGAVLLRHGEDPLLLAARQPLLFSLWHPWDKEDHYSANWTAQNTFDLAGQRVALRICSEDFALYWTLYDFATDRPTLLLSLSNHWWTRDPRVALTQAQHLRAAARLFNVPVVRAANSAVPERR